MLDRSLLFYETYQAAEPLRACLPCCSASTHGVDGRERSAVRRLADGRRHLGPSRGGPAGTPGRAAPAVVRVRLGHPAPGRDDARRQRRGRRPDLRHGHGGTDIARLFDGMGRPLRSIGGRGRWASAHARRARRAAARRHRAGRRAGSIFHGPLEKRAAFRFVGATARVTGHGAQVVVEHRSTANRGR